MIPAVALPQGITPQGLSNLPLPQKRRALELLRAKATRRGDACRYYSPLPSTAGFHRTKKRFAIIFGGNRSGKTESNMANVALIARGLHPYFKDRKFKLIWVATNTFDMVANVLWQEKLQRYIPPSEIEKIVWHNKARNCPGEILVKGTGTRIRFKAYEQGREKFQAASVDLIALDEQCDQAIWQECQMRVADNSGYIRMSCTPIIYQDWLETIANNPPDDYWVGYASLNDNRQSCGGYVPDDVIDGLIAEWPESIRVTRVEGHFAAFEGAVFPQWDAQIHTTTPRDLPREWEHYVFVDFGYSNPFCALLAARDPDNCWWFIAEHYKPQMLLRDHAAVLREWQSKFKIQAFIGDHDAQDRAELVALGISVKPAQKDVLRSIEVMGGALNVQPNGRTGIQVFKPVAGDWRGCPNLIREIPAYRWAPASATRNAREEPIKLDDHAVDAARMGVYTLRRDIQRGARGGSLV